MQSREIHFVKAPDGIPEPDCFQTVVTEVADPRDGELLVRNLYMSVDPAMRPPLSNGQMKLGSVMTGGAIGKVVASKHASFRAGAYVMSRLGFREYFVSDGRDLTALVPDRAPLSAYLSVLGLTGLTAYAGLLDVGELKAGETVFVSAAAGAVGSIAGQIAKIKGCRAIGSCGSDEKVAYLTGELGFDYAFNYKTADIRKELRAAAPDGLDVYFDNVGGNQLDAALGRMRQHGRIPVCGMISAYNSRGARSEGVTSLSNMIYNRVTMRGFVVYDYLHLLDTFRSEMAGWIAEGKLKYRETISEGIASAPAALIGLFTGANTGKTLVRLSANE